MAVFVPSRTSGSSIIDEKIEEDILIIKRKNIEQDGEIISLNLGLTNLDITNTGTTGSTTLTIGTSTSNILLKTINVTPEEANITGNWFRVRNTGNYTINFRRYGDIVFYSIPPNMNTLDPFNPIHNATSNFPYFEFTGFIPVQFRPSSSMNRVVIPTNGWKGSSGSFHPLNVHMISNGLVVVQLYTPEEWIIGELSGWHTNLQGNYRLV